MAIRRIAWIILIAASAALYFFSNETVTLAILVVAIVTPLISAILMMLASGKIGAQIIKEAEQSEGLKIRLINTGVIPAAGVKAQIKCKNLRTRESDAVSMETGIGGRSYRDFAIADRMIHAGRYEIQTDELYVSDPLMLFRKRIRTGQRQAFTKMPHVRDMVISLTSSSAAMPESDRYAESRGGNDPGEVRSIREYVAGDPVKNIHWKLSEKTDRLLVKELGLPVTDDLLVVMDTSSVSIPEPDGLDAIAEVFASIMRTLRMEDISFSVTWPEEGGLPPVIRKIMSDEDLASAADGYLAVPASRESLFEGGQSRLADNRFAHMVIVGPQLPSGISQQVNGCSITALIYGYGGTLNMDGTQIIGFDSADDNVLSALEI